MAFSVDICHVPFHSFVAGVAVGDLVSGAEVIWDEVVEGPEVSTVVECSIPVAFVSGVVEGVVECSIPAALVSGVVEGVVVGDLEDVLSDDVGGVVVEDVEDEDEEDLVFLDSVPYVVNARAKKRKRNFFPTVSIADWDLPVLATTKLANDDGKKRISGAGKPVVFNFRSLDMNTALCRHRLRVKRKKTGPRESKLQGENFGQKTTRGSGSGMRKKLLHYIFRFRLRVQRPPAGARFRVHCQIC